MLKLIGCILILSASTTAGFLYSDNFKNRVSQLNEIQRCLHQLQNEILFTYTPLTESFLSVSTKSKYPVKHIFESASDSLITNKANSVYEAMKSAIDNNINKFNIKNEDIEILLDLSKSLGESDIEGQKSVFNLTIENIKKQINEADEIMKKNVKLFRYLGFTIGAMLVILIV
ncbi:MAG: stage III sporulation protein SpoAB [Clostridiaceae bacterium]|nr:stage III sporulation protein SpoAB [Clostridiaceae bacterium]